MCERKCISVRVPVCRLCVCDAQELFFPCWEHYTLSNPKWPSLPLHYIPRTPCSPWPNHAKITCMHICAHILKRHLHLNDGTITVIDNSETCIQKCKSFSTLTHPGDNGPHQNTLWDSLINTLNGPDNTMKPKWGGWVELIHIFRHEWHIWFIYTRVPYLNISILQLL